MKSIFSAIVMMLLLFSAVFAQKADSGYFKSFDSTRIYYEVHGSGYPVVMVHGFVVNGNSWKRGALFTDLLQKGYKIITMDLRGNGKSDKPTNDSAYMNDAEAKDIMGLLDYLHINLYHLIGYSRGSIISTRLMVKDKRVDKVVLGGMGADFTNPQWPRRVLFYRTLNGDTLPPSLEGFMKFTKQTGLNTKVLALIQKYQPSTSEEELAKCKNKVMVICGDEDKDNGDGKALAKLIPNATFVEVPGVHNTTMQTKAFSDAVTSFLEK
ncbi:alpha/beta hydrolase [Chitinophagaceae bacterium 26-R-25]|nr:alpha/beta hydrolase [Chitinophagaceae bacterium 26-R-25]